VSFSMHVVQVHLGPGEQLWDAGMPPCYGSFMAAVLQQLVHRHKPRHHHIQRRHIKPNQTQLLQLTTCPAIHAWVCMHQPTAESLQQDSPQNTHPLVLACPLSILWL
jgi:hypothetical protein